MPSTSRFATISEKLQSDDIVSGTFLKSGSPLITEAVGLAPVDLLVVDFQHSERNLGRLGDIIRAADIHELPVIVRIPSQDLSLVNAVLDLGACGLMIPQVDGPEEIRSITDEVRYDANRSFALSTRAGELGTRDVDEYIAQVHDQIQIIPQIESKEGHGSVEEIARMDEVNLIMVGPADLALSYDLPINGPDITEKIVGIHETVNSIDGCEYGVYAGTEEELQSAIDQNPSFVIYSSDISIIGDHLAHVFSEHNDER